MTDEIDFLGALESDLVSDAPIAPTLRRCILLGGRARSSELRDWASQELNGYGDGATVPDYRKISAPIVVDMTVGNQWRKGQVISPSIIPDYAREVFVNGPIFYEGIGEIEAMSSRSRADGGGFRMSHQYAMDVCASMDKASGNPFQQTTALYWNVSASSLSGVVEHVRTKLTELVAEMRSQTPVGQSLPSHSVASEAVRVIIQGSPRKSKS